MAVIALHLGIECGLFIFALRCIVLFLGVVGVFHTKVLRDCPPFRVDHSLDDCLDMFLRGVHHGLSPPSLPVLQGGDDDALECDGFVIRRARGHGDAPAVRRDDESRRPDADCRVCLSVHLWTCDRGLTRRYSLHGQGVARHGGSAAALHHPPGEGPD